MPRKNQWDYWSEICEKQRIRVYTQDDKIKGFVRHEDDTFLKKVAENPNGTMECYLVSNVIGMGPKIVRPDKLNLEAMENIDINIKISDYHQPFQTMHIELPENYYRDRIAYNPQENIEHNATDIIVDYIEGSGLIIVGVFFWGPKNYNEYQVITCPLYNIN